MAKFRILNIVIVFMFCAVTAASAEEDVISGNMLLQENPDSARAASEAFEAPKPIISKYGHVTASNTIHDVLSHPAFKGFSQFILPVAQNPEKIADMPLSAISKIMPYHNYISPTETVASINYLIDESNKGRQIFYYIYDGTERSDDILDEEDEADKAAALEDTGLFFCRGKPNAPFALLLAGGYSYIASIHEGFPLARRLIKAGFNVFVLHYRMGSMKLGNEDLAKAITFIFKHADELEVDTNGYSIWGGASGASMASYIGHYGPSFFDGDVTDKPVAMILEYPVGFHYKLGDPPTFIVVGYDDYIANPQLLKAAVNTMNAEGGLGVFKGIGKVGHGFGLGVNTRAAGWHNEAISFWEDQIKNFDPDLLYNTISDKEAERAHEIFEQYTEKDENSN